MVLNNGQKRRTTLKKLFGCGAEAIMTKICTRFLNSDLNVQQIDSKHIQDISDVADHRCKHCRTPSRSVRLNRDATHTDMALKGSLDILYHYYMCRCAVKTVMLHLRHRLKLAIPMINQIHHSTDGSRGVKVFCQCFYHAGFSFSQPDGTQDKFSPIS